MGGVAVYLELKEDIDRRLQIELTWMKQLFSAKYTDLLTAEDHHLDGLTDEFLKRLNDIHGYKNQFVIFALEAETSHQVYSAGGIENAQLSLPEDFLSNDEGFYDLYVSGQSLLHRQFYRILISKPDWGILVIGMENRTFFEVADDFKDVLLLGVPLTFILVLLGGRFLARLAMRPVMKSAEAAQKITMTNLSERLPEYTGDDEFGKLVSTLNHMIGRLEQGINRVQEFTQDAAHELRTPLTTLRGELELAYQQNDLPDDLKTSIAKSLEKAILMSKIIDNLMLLAQSDTGNYPTQKSTFRFDELVRDAVEDVKSMVDGRPIEVQLSHCDEVKLSADKQLIHRLVLNLCDNAAKFTKRGTIEVGLISHAKNVEFAVRDTGIGIPQENVPHIFDRFYRVGKSRNSANGGSGLGLAICKWIVDIHGGEITFDSNVSRGTRVTVSLPKQTS